MGVRIKDVERPSPSPSFFSVFHKRRDRSRLCKVHRYYSNEKCKKMARGNEVGGRTGGQEKGRCSPSSKENFYIVAESGIKKSSFPSTFAFVPGNSVLSGSAKSVPFVESTVYG